MAWEKHDIVVVSNDTERRTKEFKGVWLYRDKYGNLKDYKMRRV